MVCIESKQAYVYGREKRECDKKTIYMHRQIMHAPKGFDVDHRDHNTLDNRRSNLRVCTRSQNLQNKRPQGGVSEYKGVRWHTQIRRWHARIKLNGKRTSLGCFTDEVKAAKAYDKAAREMFGEFACTNFKETEPIT